MAATTTPQPVFETSVSGVDEATLAHSWHDGCPIGVDELRSITMSYWGFDGRVHQGEMVVHVDHVEDVITVFQALFHGGFPIESMTPIGALPEGAEDQPGYANTSGFHCRFVEGTTRWSEHALGRAIDINPFLNPLVSSNEIWPVGSDRYVDRTLGEPGMITDGDLVVSAFTSIGWGWGGHFRSLKDYHHFSSTGR